MSKEAGEGEPATGPSSLPTPGTHESTCGSQLTEPVGVKISKTYEEHICLKNSKKKKN